MTQVPPIRNSSAIIALAPWPAAILAARTPPDPPPMTNRSTSKFMTLPAPVRWPGPAAHEIAAALAERGRHRALHFPGVNQAEPTRSATVSDRVYSAAARDVRS